MFAVMKILSGTFRLAIVTVALTGGYKFLRNYAQHNERTLSDLRGATTLECASKLSDELLKLHLDQSVIDLAEVGCSSTRFNVSMSEIAEVRNGKNVWKAWAEDERRAAIDPTGALLRVFFVFVLTNILGALTLVGMRVYGWVAAGFKGKP